MTEQTLAGTARPRGSGFRKLVSQEWAGVAALGTFFALIVVAFSILSPYFLQSRNLMAIGSNMSVIGLMAVAGTPLIVAGGLDLSVAAIAGLCGVLVSLMFGAGANIWLACSIAVVLSVGLGAINGFLVTRLKLNPLIVTLGTMSIFGGGALVLTNGLSRPLLIDGFNWLGSGRVIGAPVPVIILALFTIGTWWVMSRTKFGREIYAAGGNPDASRLMGINVDRIQVILYIYSAVIGALAGIVLAAMLGAAAPNAASQDLLTVIAAIILGGTSLFGGRGTVWGTLLAVLILGTLNNGLTLLNVSSFWQEVTRGAVLIAAVAFDQIRIRASSE